MSLFTDTGIKTMTRKIFVHDITTGESYERDMTDEENAQAEIDEQLPKQYEEPIEP
jgi:hypothetical protein